MHQGAELFPARVRIIARVGGVVVDRIAWKPSRDVYSIYISDELNWNLDLKKVEYLENIRTIRELSPDLEKIIIAWTAFIDPLQYFDI